MLSSFLAVLLILISAFLILLVLIQRGRGGGLAGAFGGMGGQSAFGAKAGDMFTRLTIGVAAVWIVLCIVSLKVMNAPTNRFTGTGGAANQDTLPADDSPAPDSSNKGGAGADKSAAEGASGPALGGAAAPTGGGAGSGTGDTSKAAK